MTLGSLVSNEGEAYQARLVEAERIANAVLYEGYILYPYRPSAVKNRQRWTFGGVYPQAYSQAQGEPDSWWTQTECLAEADPSGATPLKLTLKLRFLHLVQRQIGELDPNLPDGMALNFRPVASLRVGSQVFYTWQEAVEREVTLPDLLVADLPTQPYEFNFAFPGSSQLESLPKLDGQIVGVIVREQQAVNGVVAVTAQAHNGLYKLTIRVQNLTPCEAAHQKSRDEVLLQSFVSTHAILSLQGGQFISLLDPPGEYQALTAACRNLGTYPVLVGVEGVQDMLLSSPIILYDYPQIAPESPGDLFDGTEIDEILTLRILAMTDEEKEEMRQVDERARALLDRTEALSGEDLMKLHGTIRNLRPARGNL